MGQTRASTLLAGACQWIRENHVAGERTHHDLAVIYVKGQDDLTALRRAVEQYTGEELSLEDEDARIDIALILAELAGDMVRVIDLTVEDADTGFVFD